MNDRSPSLVPARSVRGLRGAEPATIPAVGRPGETAAMVQPLTAMDLPNPPEMFWIVAVVARCATAPDVGAPGFPGPEVARCRADGTRRTLPADLPRVISIGRLDYNTEDNFDLNNDGVDDLILDYYSHQKYLVVQGTYNGVPDTSMVLTGSVNWSSLSTANDEVWFTVRGAVVAKKYLTNFNYQWDHARNSRNAYTTTYANFRVRRTVTDADGTTRTVWRTVRRPVVTVERDPYRKGPYWEDD